MNAQAETPPLIPGGPRRPRTRQRATIAAWALVVATCAPGSPALSSQTSPPPEGLRASDPSTDRRARVERLAHDVLEVAKLPSLSVALLDGDQLDEDEPTLRFALGHENIENDRPATPSTRYRAASVSKLFTATALARLVDADRTDWDASVADLVPTFPGLEGVTLRHLAGHLGGIGHYQSTDQIERFVPTPDVQEALAFFRESPRVGPSGAQMHYTTHGYTLLSAALETAAEIPFLDLIEREVAAPLGLQHTGPAWLPREREQMTPAPDGHSELYMITPGGPKPFPKPESASYKWAGGGFATTPSDLVRLGRAYLQSTQEPGFLRPETVQLMWTSQSIEGDPTGTGIGWRVGHDGQGRPVRHHAGSMQGARSVLLLDPDRRDAIAVMTNASWNSAIETTAILLLDSWRLPPPATPQATFRGDVQLEVWIEPHDGAPGERATGQASWSDGALDLPAPDGLRQRARSWNTDLRIRPIAAERWALVSTRGAGPGTCTQAETGTRSCRFRFTHDADLRVDWSPATD